MSDTDFAAIAKRYAEDVCEGRILACKWVKLACQRQLNDLKRTDWKWRFNPILIDSETGREYRPGERVCKFIELQPHIKGEWARSRKPITLEPWQIFILTTVFGWVDENGLRRFKTVYTEIARKNAKSTISSGVALYLLTADNEPGAEVYSAATTRDQARIVWGDAHAMTDRNAQFRAYYGVENSAHAIFVKHNNSTFKPLSRDQGGNLDGLNIHGAIVDELHGHKTRDLWDVLVSGTGARSQPLIWAITTAGFNRAGICYEQRSYITRILDGVHDDEEYFGIIYTIDEDDEWTDPKCWPKANPNWGISVDPGAIEREARKAMQMAAATNNFLTKHLNVWVNADTAWMDMQAWDACEDRELNERQFEGETLVGGLDLASKVDIAANLKVFSRTIDGEIHYYIFGKFYLPEEAAEDGRNRHYAGWARDGHLILTSGNVTDYGVIIDDIRADASRFQIGELGFDPWNATYVATLLMEDGINMVEVRQTVANLSEPMKTLEALVLSKRLHHDGNPVMTWMISNVVAHLDAKDNIFPRKEFPENKIDGVVALLIALNRVVANEKPPTKDIFVVL